MSVEYASSYDLGQPLFPTDSQIIKARRMLKYHERKVRNWQRTLDNYYEARNEAFERAI